MDSVPPRRMSGNPPRDFLVFHIAGRPYRVTISPRPLRENGRDASTAFYPATRELRISPHVDPAQRLAVLTAQIRQAWDMTDTAEPREDASSMRTERVAMALVEDLSSQGGADALRAMVPPGTVPAAPPPRSPLQGLPTGAEKAMRRWEAMGRDLLNPDFELTLEEAAPLFATFTQLVNAGVRFDPTLSALVRVLKRQGFKNDGESDYDYRGKESCDSMVNTLSGFTAAPHLHPALR
jgi:hypothetical protein